MGPETDFSKAVYSPSSAGLRLSFAARHSPKQPCGLVGDGPRAPKRSGPSRAAGSQWPAAAQNSTAVNPGATHSRRKAGLARPEPGLPVFGGFGPGADACAFEAMKECPRREGPFNRTGLARPRATRGKPSMRTAGLLGPRLRVLSEPDWPCGFPVRRPIFNASWIGLEDRLPSSALRAHSRPGESQMEVAITRSASKPVPLCSMW